MTRGSPLPTGLRVWLVNYASHTPLSFLKVSTKREVWRSSSLSFKTCPEAPDFGLIDWGARQPRFDVRVDAHRRAHLIFAITKGDAVLAQESVSLGEIKQMM